MEVLIDMDDLLVKKLEEINLKYKAFDKFSLISAGVLNKAEKKYFSYGVDYVKFLEHYSSNKLIQIDPIVDVILKTDVDLILFEHLKIIEKHNKKGKILKAGKIIDDERKKFYIHNGFTWVNRMLNKNFIIGISFGVDHKNFEYFKYFDQRKPDGKWFTEYFTEIQNAIYNSAKKNFVDNNKSAIKKHKLFKIS